MSGSGEVPSLGEGDATTRFHQSNCWISRRPLAARAQTQPDGARRIGVLMGLAETDPFTIKYVQVLRAALEKLGWTDNQNVQFAYRYAAGDPGRARAYAKELVDIYMTK